MTLLGLFEPFAFGAVLQHDMTGLTAHVLDAMGDLLMATMHHRALHRVTQIAAGALGHIALVRVGVAALRALEAFFGRFEVALETTHEAVVDRSVRTKVADADVVA